jgi:hypothetical protein
LRAEEEAKQVTSKKSMLEAELCTNLKMEAVQTVSEYL